MSRIYKLVSFISISVLLAFFSMKLESNFADQFAENILSLLTTLFAINIASSTLIAGKLREIQNKTGCDFPKTKKNLKNSFYEQIMFIGVVFVFGLLRESKYIHHTIDIDKIKLRTTLVFACLPTQTRISMPFLFVRFLRFVIPSIFLDSTSSLISLQKPSADPP